MGTRRTAVAVLRAPWVVMLLAAATPSAAAQTVANPCDPDASAAECLCRQGPPPRAGHLEELRAGALGVRRAVCAADEDTGSVRGRLVDVLRATRDWFDAYGGFTAAGGAGGDGGSVNANGAILDIIDLDQGVPTVQVTRDDALMIDGRILLAPADPEACDARAASELEGSACVDVLDEFAAYYNHAQASYAFDSAYAFARHARALRRDWQAYLDDARSQTVLELAVNSYLYRRSEEARFSPPPDWQLILLHPNVVLEHVDAANDGERFEEGLMLELIGANYWRQDRWYLPSGGSLIATYSDRAAVDDWGYGVALHFANAYTLGASRRSGETGYLLSVDLLKLFEDQRDTLGAFGR